MFDDEIFAVERCAGVRSVETEAFIQQLTDSLRAIRPNNLYRTKC